MSNKTELPATEATKKAHEAWQNMRQRCTNSKHPAYHNYGGRGVQIEWGFLINFNYFLGHIGLPKHKGLSLDRINNSGHYEPGNVHWTDAKGQMNNTRKQYGNDMIMTSVKSYEMKFSESEMIEKACMKIVDQFANKRFVIFRGRMFESIEKAIGNAQLDDLEITIAKMMFRTKAPYINSKESLTARFATQDEVESVMRNRIMKTRQDIKVKYENIS